MEWKYLKTQTNTEIIYLLSRNAPGNKQNENENKHLILEHSEYKLWIVSNTLQLKSNYLIMTQLKFWSSNPKEKGVL